MGNFELTEDETSFAYRLSNLRKDHNLSQKQLADQLHVTHSQISRIESGETKCDLTVHRTANAQADRCCQFLHFKKLQHQLLVCLCVFSFHYNLPSRSTALWRSSSASACLQPSSRTSYSQS